MFYFICLLLSKLLRMYIATYQLHHVERLLSPYMSEVLKCPTNFWKKCPYMSDILKCPTNFWKKCPYMSDILKCPPFSFPIVLICPPALHLFIISYRLVHKTIIDLKVTDWCMKRVRFTEGVDCKNYVWWFFSFEMVWIILWRY
jgi:hypothetical protein